MGPIFHIQLLHPDTRHSCKKILAESHQKKSYWRKDYFSVHQSNVQAYFKQNSSSGALKRALASPTADWATTHDPQNDYRDVSLNCLQVRHCCPSEPFWKTLLPICTFTCPLDTQYLKQEESKFKKNIKGLSGEGERKLLGFHL